MHHQVFTARRQPDLAMRGNGQVNDRPHYHPAAYHDHFMHLDGIELYAVDTDQSHCLIPGIAQGQVAGMQAGAIVGLAQPGAADMDHVARQALGFRLHVSDQIHGLTLVQAHVGHGDLVVLAVKGHGDGILSRQHLIRSTQPIEQPLQLAHTGDADQVRADGIRSFNTGQTVATGAAGAEQLLAGRDRAQFRR